MATSVHSLALLLACVCLNVSAERCDVRAHTTAGWVCGTCRWPGIASFLGVPYAQQPLGERRFQELHPLERWEGCLDASKEGPICPQRDVLYGRLMQPNGISEACIHANIHVPLERLPERAPGASNHTRLPVLVMLHGGGFMFGSGDPDLHGPQYLLRNDVVVVTFNYRLGPFGFLSLNTSSIPGNAGLRDMLTLLHWVQSNIEKFGGDPNSVTLMGQSAGAAAAHLLSLSSASNGLFHKVIALSGSGTRSFFTTSPVYAQSVAQLFLDRLGVDSTDPEEAHRALVALSLHQILNASDYLQDLFGIAVFLPVVENPHPGVTSVLDEHPDVLQAEGRGKNISFLIGFTNKECETFRPRFDAIDILTLIKQTPLLVLPPEAIYTTPANQVATKIHDIEQRYFNGTPTMEKYVNLCSDMYYKYPAYKMAQGRADSEGAPVYLYRFGYNAGYSVIKDALGIEYYGAAHVEDLTYVFYTNSMLQVGLLSPEDELQRKVMTGYVINFMRSSNPSTGVAGWLPVERGQLRYKNIVSPTRLETKNISRKQQRMIQFFDGIYNTNS